MQMEWGKRVYSMITGTRISTNNFITQAILSHTQFLEAIYRIANGEKPGNVQIKLENRVINVRFEVKNIIRNANIINIENLNIYIGGEPEKELLNAKEALRRIWNTINDLEDKISRMKKQIAKENEKNELTEVVNKLAKIREKLKEKDPELANEISDILHKIIRAKAEERREKEEIMKKTREILDEIGEKTFEIKRTITNAVSGSLINNKNKIDVSEEIKTTKIRSRLRGWQKVYFGKQYAWLEEQLLQYCKIHGTTPSNVIRQSLIEFFTKKLRKEEKKEKEEKRTKNQTKKEESPANMLQITLAEIVRKLDKIKRAIEENRNKWEIIQNIETIRNKAILKLKQASLLRIRRGEKNA